MIIDFGNYKHQIISAYENFKRRYAFHYDYYRALNETCKSYLIEHDMFKVVLSRIDNAKKRYKKEWKEEYIKHLEINRDQKLIDELFEEFKEESKTKIIQIKR
jgi:GTP1/Obg family GTP-binding protein